MIKILDLEKTNPLYKYCQKAFNNINNKPFYKAVKEFLILKNKKYNGVIYLEETGDQLEKVSKIMRDNGFNVIDKDFDDTNSNVEIHYSSCNDENVEYVFDVHDDDYGGIDCLLHTCIIYFDVECNGGELAFYDGFVNRNMIQKIDVNSKSDNVKMVIFRGDLYHNALPYTQGHRYLVSFQFKRDD